MVDPEFGDVQAHLEIRRRGAAADARRAFLASVAMWEATSPSRRS